MISLVCHLGALYTLPKKRISNLTFVFMARIMKEEINLHKTTFKILHKRKK